MSIISTILPQLSLFERMSGLIGEFALGDKLHRIPTLLARNYAIIRTIPIVSVRREHTLNLSTLNTVSNRLRAPSINLTPRAEGSPENLLDRPFQILRH